MKLKLILIICLSVTFQTVYAQNQPPARTWYQNDYGRNTTVKERWTEDANGLKHGTYIKYFKDGKREILGHYTHDVANGVWEVSVNIQNVLQNISSITYTNMVNGVQEGASRTVCNGVVIFQGNYSNDEKVGYWKDDYDFDAKIYSEGNYLKGKKNGEWKNTFVSIKSNDENIFGIMMGNYSSSKTEIKKGYRTIYKSDEIVAVYDDKGTNLYEEVLKEKKIKDQEKKKNDEINDFNRICGTTEEFRRQKYDEYRKNKNTDFKSISNSEFSWNENLSSAMNKYPNMDNTNYKRDCEYVMSQYTKLYSLITNFDDTLLTRDNNFFNNYFIEFNDDVTQGCGYRDVSNILPYLKANFFDIKCSKINSNNHLADIIRKYPNMITPNDVKDFSSYLYNGNNRISREVYDNIDSRISNGQLSDALRMIKCIEKNSPNMNINTSLRKVAIQWYLGNYDAAVTEYNLNKDVEFHYILEWNGIKERKEVKTYSAMLKSSYKDVYKGIIQKLKIK